MWVVIGFCYPKNIANQKGRPRAKTGATFLIWKKEQAVSKKICVNPSTTFTIRLDSEQKFELEELAQQQGVPPVQLGREAISMLLAAQKQKNPIALCDRVFQ